MTLQTLDNKRKIIRVIEHLIAKRIEIRIWLEGEKTIFTSRFIRVDLGSISSGREPGVIIEKLFPEEGNALIQSLPKVAVEFSISQSLFQCSLKYIGISNIPPHIGFILSLPESLEIEEKRSEERFVFEHPEFISVEFRLGKKTKKDRLYQLNVLDCSEHGLGLLITLKNFDLLRILHEGFKLEDMTFFSSWAMIKVNGTVRHITKIEDGEYKDCYRLGIHSSEIIEGCKPNSD